MTHTNQPSKEFEFVFSSTPMELKKRKKFKWQNFRIEKFSRIEIVVSIIAFFSGFALAFLFT